MKGRKAPAPVVFRLVFSKNTVLGDLYNGDDISPFNGTNITLIPKINNPLIYWALQCYLQINFLTIVNRLKPHMNSIIHDSQSAFCWF